MDGIINNRGYIFFYINPMAIEKPSQDPQLKFSNKKNYQRKVLTFINSSQSLGSVYVIY